MIFKSVISLSCFFVVFFSCSDVNTEQKIVIDLEKDVDTIYYSSFVKSIDYLTLNTRDTCLISGVEKLFIDEDTIIIQDTGREGIFVFTKSGDIIKQINYRGNGPNEFTTISAFAIDPVLNHICIYDRGSLKIIKYTYQGDFVKSYKTENLYARDFTVMENEDNLFILPFYDRKQTSGVWLSDTNGITKKIYINDVPADDEFEYTGNYYNRSDEGIYYYDRNWDDFSYITKDTLTKLFQFDLKQKVPREIRIKRDWRAEELEGYTMMSSFVNATNYLLIVYYIFGDRPYYKYKWVFLNKSNNDLICSKHLINDMDNTQSDFEQLYYLNDSTWCRLLNIEENNCNLYLQILRLKESW
ncbi:MAG: 6-bladed beta-propeller [Tannerellaceae bacterium]|jgi:hypothetical protein|nr:6-bladed beta-propeller [Tannerellaceae bacterium]